MRILRLLLIAATIVITSCKDKNNGTVESIAIVPEEGTLNASSLFDGYEIIVPEGVLISGIADIAVSDSMLVILGETDHGMINIFDRRGRHINSFLKRGRGPEEMTDVTAMSYNRKDGTLDVLGNYGMTVYTFELPSGRMLKSFSLENSEIMCARDILSLGGGKYLFYKDLSYVDGPEYEVYLYNSETSGIEGKWIPLYKEFAEVAGFAQSNNLFEYNGKYYFYSAFSDGLYRLSSDGLIPYRLFEDNRYNFSQEMKSKNVPQDLMAFVEFCQNSGKIWGHVDLYMIGDKTRSIYNYGKDRYAVVMDTETNTSTSYTSYYDDMVWGIETESFFTPFYLRYTDSDCAVFLVEPSDIVEAAESQPTQAPEFLANRKTVSALPYEANQMILLMRLSK